MSNIHTMKAEIKLKHVYTCALCGKKSLGDMITEVFYCNTTDMLKALIEHIDQESNAMPVGWSYNGKFTCSCKKNN